MTGTPNDVLKARRMLDELKPVKVEQRVPVFRRLKRLPAYLMAMGRKIRNFT
jgi:hypothetical protein